jgi:ribulose bisphosphate carboxylase small subunit
MLNEEILQMLKSKDEEMQRLGITLLGYKETREHLNELNKMLAEYKIQMLRLADFDLDNVYIRRKNHLVEYDDNGGSILFPVKRNEKDENDE